MCQTGLIQQGYDFVFVSLEPGHTKKKFDHPHETPTSTAPVLFTSSHVSACTPARLYRETQIKFASQELGWTPPIACRVPDLAGKPGIKGVIGSLPPPAWLVPSIQAPSGQVCQLQQPFVWLRFPTSQARWSCCLVTQMKQHPTSFSSLHPAQLAHARTARTRLRGNEENLCISGARLGSPFCMQRARFSSYSKQPIKRRLYATSLAQGKPGNQSAPKSTGIVSHGHIIFQWW